MNLTLCNYLLSIFLICSQPVPAGIAAEISGRKTQEPTVETEEFSVEAYKGITQNRNSTIANDHLAIGKVLQQRGYYNMARAEYNAAIRFSPERRNEEASRLLDELAKKHESLMTKRGKAMPQLQEFKKAVQSRWKPPAHDEFLETLIDVTFDSNGKIVKRKVMVSSNNDEQDKSASDILDVVELGKLPEGLEDLEVHFVLKSDRILNYIEISLNPRDLASSTPIHVRKSFLGSVGPTARVLSDMGDTTFRNVFEKNHYLFNAHRNIRKNWNQSNEFSDKYVLVLLRIQNDGAVSNLRLGRSSGSAPADQAALRAIESTPFDPLPKGAPRWIDIQYSFGRTPF